MPSTWHTSVNELLHVFQQSLTALLPVMEKAHIAWREGDAYDDWDEISQVLYRNIVGRSLAFASSSEADLDTILPHYDGICDSYANLNRIEVYGPDEENKGVFVALSTNEQPFDTVDFVPLGSDGRPVARNRKHTKLADVLVKFRYAGGRVGEIIEQLNVDL